MYFCQYTSRSVNVYDVAGAQGEGDIKRLQSRTDLDVHCQNPYNDFIILQQTLLTFLIF